MLAIAAISKSISGDYIFIEKINDADFTANRIKPWQLARLFKDRMGAIPLNIFIINGEEEMARWYAGDDFPGEDD